MLSPDIRESARASIRRALRLIERIRALPALAEPLAAFERAVDLYQSAYKAWQDARTRAVIATGVCRESVRALQDELRGVALTAITVDRGCRTRLVRQFFPQGWGGALRKRPQILLSTAAGVLARIAEDEHPDIHARCDRLVAAIEALTSAVASRQAARNAAAEATAALRTEKYAWRQAYFRFYFEVRLAYPEHRKEADALFRTRSRKRRAAAEAPVQEGGSDGIPDPESDGADGSPDA